MRVLAALTAVLIVAPTALAGGGDRRHLEVLRSDRSEVSWILRVPESATEVRVRADGAHEVRVAGLGVEHRSDGTAIPVAVTSVGVPRGASVEVVADGPVEWDDVVFRGVRILRVRQYPVQALGAGRFRTIPRIRVDVRFRGGAGLAVHAGGPFSSVTRRILERALLNGPAILAGAEPETLAAPESTSSTNSAVKIRVDREGLVRVTYADLVAAGFNPSGVDPRRLQMYYRLRPIPCSVSGEADGSFDPGDAVEFYGRPANSRFAAEGVYWLEELPEDGQGGAGLRFATREAAPAGATATSFPSIAAREGGNSLYSFGPPGTVEEDPRFFWVWFEDNPNPPRVTSFSDLVDVVDRETAAGQAVLRAWFLGRSNPTANPDHRIRLSINGAVAGESVWDGQQFHLAEIGFDAAWLAAGSNTVTFDMLAIAVPDAYYLDRYEIEYRRTHVARSDGLVVARASTEGTLRRNVQGISAVGGTEILDVTDPLAPQRLTGWTYSGSGPFTVQFRTDSGSRYLVAGPNGRIAPAGLSLDVPSSLRGPGAGADLLVIVPDAWTSAVAPLVARREAEGLRVVVAKLTDVADEFAGGNVDDSAIREFVRYAYFAWPPPALSGVLLVGEPNMDPRNFLGRSPFYHLMPTHPGVTAAQGDTTVDTWFGAIDGDDPVPDVAVGRLSVRTSADLSTLIAKLLAHEDVVTGASAWERNVVHVASNEQQFEAGLEQAATRLPEFFTVDREYRREGATTASIAAAINAGASLVSFLGHGEIALWGDKGVGFWRNGDVYALTNGGRLPFVTALNCVNGAVAHPSTTDSMSEAFTWRPSTGAIGVWSSSSSGYLDEYEILLTHLYETVFVDHDPFLGAATLEALVGTYLTGVASEDLLRKMVLLGDPFAYVGVDSEDDRVVDARELWAGVIVGDRDSDDDGLIDGLEPSMSADSDGDGAINALDPDSDNDGLPDGLEAGKTAPDVGTDTARGYFRADTHPASTTDPLDADSDGGGAPDGVEDRDADGFVDAGESDPRSGADDPVCSLAPPPEVARGPAVKIRAEKTATAVRLTWGAPSGVDPCLLYRVYASAGTQDPASKSDFDLIGVTAGTSFDHEGALTDPSAFRYVIVGATLAGGEGPWGHFED